MCLEFFRLKFVDLELQKDLVIQQFVEIEELNNSLILEFVEKIKVLSLLQDEFKIVLEFFIVSCKVIKIMEFEINVLLLERDFWQIEFNF